MSRDNRIQIRWNDHEKETVDKARGDIDFSQYVRDAAMEKALKELGETEDGSL